MCSALNHSLYKCCRNELRTSREWFDLRLHLTEMTGRGLLPTSHLKKKQFENYSNGLDVTSFVQIVETHHLYLSLTFPKAMSCICVREQVCIASTVKSLREWDIVTFIGLLLFNRLHQTLKLDWMCHIQSSCKIGNILTPVTHTNLIVY